FLFLFLHRMKTFSHPLLPVYVMTSKHIRNLLTANFLCSIGFGAFGFIAASVMEITFDYSSSKTGMVLALGPLLMIFAGSMTGKLVVLACAGKYLFWTGLLNIVGSVIAAFGMPSSVLIIITGLALSQFGGTWFVPAVQSNLLVRGPKDAQATVFALFYVTQCVGKSVGIALITLVQVASIDYLYGMDAPTDFDPVYARAYGVSAMLGMLACQLALSPFPWVARHIGLSELDRGKPGFSQEELDRQGPVAGAVDLDAQDLLTGPTELEDGRHKADEYELGGSSTSDF
ncbi:hypothetical protein KIPB_009435, partial [Kipferlia bialata]